MPLYETLPKVIAGSPVVGAPANFSLYEIVTTIPTVNGLDRPIGSTVIMSDGSGAYRKVGTAAADWQPASYRSQREKNYDRAMALCEFGQTASGDFWEDFEAQFTLVPENMGWGSNASSGGSFRRAIKGSRGGVIEYCTNTTPGASSGIYSESPLIRSGSTDKWYFAVRKYVSSSLNAIDQSQILFSALYCLGSAGGVSVGVRGSSSMTQFIFGTDGNPNWLSPANVVSTGISIDSGSERFHTFELYSKGDGICRFRGDYGTELTATFTSNPVNLCVILDVRNGAGSTFDRALGWDWVHVIFPRT